ncbi:MAG: protein-disulfide reductase DsbD family protein [Rhodospirillaceae bacterium]
MLPLRAGLAAESAPAVSPRATVTLVSDADAVTPGGSVRLGLRQRLAPHWHTYWKNPGDAGEPSEIRLVLPAGARAGEIAWPGPERIVSGPAVSFGYRDEIVLPLTVRVPETARPGERFAVSTEARWLVCAEECIPEEGRFDLDLPVAAAPRPAEGDVAAAFAAADARMPRPLPWRAELRDEGEGLALTLAGEGLSAESVRNADFFPDAWGVLDYAAPPRAAASAGRLSLALSRGPAYAPGQAVSGLLVLTDGGGAARWFSVAPLAAAPAAPAAGLWRAVLFALLGGLILNLMPCVFPVLAMKAAAVAKLSGGELREVRLSALFYTLGILSAFAALAGLLLALRAGGAAVGWGFQFQSPPFIAVMAWLMLAVGLNLSGVFAVRMPGFAGAAAGGGHAGSFFTGLLAVVVATPCTAPFMGVALGAALALPPLACLAVFLALGLGLAAPYAALALLPALSRRLPRPGPWMLRLREALAFPMYASAAWLVWVLARQTGGEGLPFGLAGAVLVAFAAWLLGFAQRGGGSRRAALAATLALAAALALLPRVDAGAPQGAAAATESEPFSAARLAELRAQGTPVFVNMTADWCLGCLLNERVALSTGAVRAAFKTGGIVYLKGDWTRRDPAITAFLRGFGRDGVPFYAFFPPGGDPRVLPPVLTETVMLGALAGAPGSPN